MHIATKTLAAIDAALEKDQGATYRGYLRAAMASIEDAYSTKEDDVRTHLGASLIGRECARELWYTFRWVKPSRFGGRMLRLFNRGHLEEGRFVALLQMIGCTVYQLDANGKQYRISAAGGHFGGSLDAVVVGCPDYPQALLSEFKTHGEKSFEKLRTEGVQRSKYEHFVQMQVYMGENNLPAALYLAVNKNTDELHAEIVQYDPAIHRRYVDRGVGIVHTYDPPPRVSESPGSFKCKFCDYKRVCHLSDPVEKTCRTCVSADVKADGEWYCTRYSITLTKEQQRKGCDAYVNLLD